MVDIKAMKFKQKLIRTNIIKKKDKISLVKVDYCEVRVICNGTYIGDASYDGEEYYFKAKRKTYETNKNDNKNRHIQSSIRGRKATPRDIRRETSPSKNRQLVASDVIKIKDRRTKTT